MEELFRILCGQKASDLHISVGSPAHAAPRRGDQARRRPRGPEPRGHRADPLAHSARAEPRGVPAAPRHRLRVRDRGAGPLPLQLLHGPQGDGRRLPGDPEQDHHRGGDGALEGDPSALQPAEGARARHRSDGLRQVDHALRPDRLHQPEPHRPHHHHRGPAGVRPRKQEVPHQPAAGRRAHRLVQGRPAGCPARGPGHRPGGGDARPRDGLDRDRDGGNGPPRLRHPPHLLGPLDGRSHRRPVSRGPAGTDPGHALGEPEGRHQPDALQEDRRRPGSGPRGPHRDPVGGEPHPRSQGLPDPLDHADGEEVRHDA